MVDAESSETKPSETEKSSQPEGSNNAFVILAIVGMTLSLVLEFIHARTYLVPTVDSFCSVGEAFDCAVVAASPKSIFLGVPWALWGAASYLAILTAAMKRSVWLLPLSGVAALASVGLLILSLAGIGTLCYLCEGVHLVSWILFGLVWKNRNTLIGSYGDTPDTLSILATPAGIALALVLFMPPYWGSYSYKAEPPFATGVTEEGYPWIGSENPDFTFHEFVDYRCPHCKLASSRTLRRLKKNGSWRMIRRQNPRLACPVGRDSACRAARLAYCAGKQDKFWRADRWLFATQNPRKDIDLAQMSRDLDLDEAQLKSCYSSAEAFQWVDAEFKVVRKKQLIDTPSYLVEDKRYREHEFEELLSKK